MALLRSLPGTLFILALAAAGLWAALTLRFETELLPVLPPDLPSVQGIKTYADLAAGQNEVFAVADPALPPEDRDRLLAETRAAIARHQALEAELDDSLQYLTACGGCGIETPRTACSTCEDQSHADTNPPVLVAALTECA